MDETKLAELAGVILGDGSIYVNKPLGIYLLRITLGMDEMPYAVFVQQLVEELFGVRPKIRFYYRDGKPKEIIVGVYSKKLLSELFALGLGCGDKSGWAGIPEWVWNNDANLSACVRGLVDTDGCVYEKHSYPGIPQIHFSSATPRLLFDFQRALVKLGFKSSKCFSSNNTPRCGIYGKHEARKYCVGVGFSNPKNKARFSAIESNLVKDYKSQLTKLIHVPW